MIDFWDTEGPPQLNGRHFRITTLQEHGFLDMDDDPSVEGGVLYSGYLIDMLEALARPERANFTYTLFPPSGYGSLCVPKLDPEQRGEGDTTTTTTTVPYDPKYRTQYKCGESDVNDHADAAHNGNNTLQQMEIDTHMYLGMYYITPGRQKLNAFTLPFVPPFSGTLAMFGTATGLEDFDALVTAQAAGEQPPACAPAGTALIDFLVTAFPGLQVQGLFGGEDELYQAFVSGQCTVFMTDGPIASQFVLRRSRRGECFGFNNQPIGVIGRPMDFGLSHYAIGVRRDVDPAVAQTLSYWINMLMSCNPNDPESLCSDGNLATFYEGNGGDGSECGYVLYPESNASGLSPEAIAGIVFASVFFVVSVYTAWHRYRLSRQRRIFRRRQKATLAIARRERELNEFVAHEIRNPLSSAIAALSFVTTKAADPELVPLQASRETLKDDIAIVDNSLQFVNELLRNMLDLHRSDEKQMILNWAPTDIMRDILEPVASIVFLRGSAQAEVTVECDPSANLIVQADRIRLKQICLNLASNASKFVEKGYIKLRAEVEWTSSGTATIKSTDTNSDGGEASALTPNVVIYVEDSGPGIPLEKRQKLFDKFQESLDVLNQGTGIGLSVCKSLSKLMGADLFLDNDFESGVSGCPGTRFVLRLNQAPMADLESNLSIREKLAFTDHSPMETPEVSNSANSVSRIDGPTIPRATLFDLPPKMSLLFVDDDTMLRRMFCRTVETVAPSDWTVRQAGDGETALRIIDEGGIFDLIFMDHYMASHNKQLLGTETISLMRSRGVDSIICGLSANDKEEEFRQAGADAFMLKPFPCQKDVLQRTLWQVLHSRDQKNEGEALFPQNMPPSPPGVPPSTQQVNGQSAGSPGPERKCLRRRSLCKNHGSTKSSLGSTKLLLLSLLASVLCGSSAFLTLQSPIRTHKPRGRTFILCAKALKVKNDPWFPIQVQFEDDIFSEIDAVAELEQKAVRLAGDLIRKRLVIQHPGGLPAEDQEVEEEKKEAQNHTLEEKVRIQQLVKNRFMDLTVAASGERMLEALFQDELVVLEKDDNIVRAAVMVIQSLCVFAMQVGVKGSPEQLKRMVSHLDPRRDPSLLERDLQQWDTDSVRRLKHRLDRVPAVQLLANLQWKRTTQGAFELLVCLGAWKPHEDLALLRSGFPLRFSEAEEDAAEFFSDIQRDPDSMLDLRKDLRHLKVFTIDSASTSEIDDGLSVERVQKKDGSERNRLWIHIADADRWAPRDSTLFEVAQKRITSLYLQSGSIPMFPHRTSTELMSLRENRDAFAVSLSVEINEDGSIDASTIALMPSIIKVTYRLTYDDVDEMLAEGIGYQEEWELGALLAAATKRRNYRINNGSTEGIVTNPVPYSSVSVYPDKTAPDGIGISVRVEVSHNAGKNQTTEDGLEDDSANDILATAAPVSSSSLLVTEAMILAGEAIGHWKAIMDKSFDKDGDDLTFPNQLRLPFRTQPKPSFYSRSREKRVLDDLREYNVGNGLCFAWYIRRFLEPVKIAETPSSHSGMGLSYYIQWTSPIRRFSDLQVHASVKRCLRRQKVKELLLKRKQLPANLTPTDLGWPEDCLAKDGGLSTDMPLTIDDLDQDIDFLQGIGFIKAARNLQRQSQQYWLYTYVERMLQSFPLLSFSAIVLGCIDPENQQYAIFVPEIGLEHRYASPLRLDPGTKLNLRVDSVYPRLGLLTFVRVV